MGLFQNTGIIPKILYTSHRINNILDVCQQTGSVALLVAPENNKINPYDENFKLIKILPDTAIDLSLCYMADRRLSHPAEEFIQYFTKHFSGKS
jgi:DNA-binding transcriptional LysR family regulator